jgi:site-specific DNA-methyltransferase (adenine-specific)
MSIEKVTIGNATLFCGDCREVLPTLPPVDCVITDPPYFKVKGDYWDNEWEKPAEFLDWMRGVLALLADRMKPNASAYVFASPQMAGRVEAVAWERLNVLGHIVWRKGRESMRPASRANASDKEALRAFWMASERVIFAEHYGSDTAAMGAAGYKDKCDEAARDTFGKYITATRAAHGLTMKQLTEAVGAYGSVNHGGACSNWEKGYNVPTIEHYKKLQATFVGCFDLEYEELRSQYEVLRNKYEDLRREYEDLRRPFSLNERDQWSDVWDFEPVAAYPGKHPCEKPLPLLAHMLKASTRPGALVLDAFMGSGAAGDACLQMGRHFIGIERDRGHFQNACRRLEHRQAQTSLFENAEA